MPFLWVQGRAEVDEVELAKRLCPYGTTVTKTGTLYHTPLARFTKPTTLETSFARSACSAHGRVDLLPAATRFTTDALGTLPLWQINGPGFIAISPEVKAFAAIAGFQPRLKPPASLTAPGERSLTYSPYENVERLSPGATLSIDHAGVLHEEKPSIWPDLLATTGSSTDTRELGDALEHSLDGAEATRGAFISGGIDSSIASALLGRKFPVKLSTWSLGTRVGNEFAQAADLARALGSDHRELQLRDDEILELWNDVIKANEISDGMTAEIVLQLAALVRHAGTGVVTGYGADLLFGGMLRHDAYMQAVGVSSTAALIARTIWTGELSPFYAWRYGVAVHPVFWSPAVIRAALRLDPAIHFDGTHEKVPLRQLAVSRGWLTETLAFRPKVGMTIGTAAYQLVAEQLGLGNVMDYAGRSRLAIARLLLELEQHAPG